MAAPPLMSRGAIAAFELVGELPEEVVTAFPLASVVVTEPEPVFWALLPHVDLNSVPKVDCAGHQLVRQSYAADWIEQRLAELVSAAPTAEAA